MKEEEEEEKKNTTLSQANTQRTTLYSLRLRFSAWFCTNFDFDAIIINIIIMVAQHRQSATIVLAAMRLIHFFLLLYFHITFFILLLRGFVNTRSCEQKQYSFGVKSICSSFCRQCFFFFFLSSVLLTHTQSLPSSAWCHNA